MTGRKGPAGHTVRQALRPCAPIGGSVEPPRAGLLLEHLTSAEYTVRFRWEPGSIAFWDNRSTCHFAPTDFAHYDNERVMHRVTILGDVPVAVDGSVSELLGGEPTW